MKRVLIKPPEGALRDAGRRISICIATDIYNAVVKEMHKRHAATGVTPTLAAMIQDALIAHYEIGMEESA